MLSILVPTDLSDLSKVAARYAVKMANKLDGRVTLVHVITMRRPVRATLQQRARTMEKELIQAAEIELAQLVKELSKHARFSKPIQYHAVTGATFHETVKKEARKHAADIIVMGTHGASGLKKVVLGSNTTTMIGVSTIPVLAVPEDAEFKSLRNVVYASDLRSLQKELGTLIPYAEKFNAMIHLVHVAPVRKNIQEIEAKMESAVQQAGYKKAGSIVLADDDVDDAIEQYVIINKPDLLVMFTHDPTFYEKLFDRSFTRRMAFHSKVPLLAFKHRRK
jgi:nucleotide-binding universal stress UspA family protein